MYTGTAQKEIVSRCIEWNAARYNQEYSHDLAVRLLLEEIHELFEAKTVVDKLDAIGDIVFVAIGVWWKIGCSKELIEAFIYAEDLRYIALADAYSHMDQVMEQIVFSSREEDLGVIQGAYLACMAVFVICLSQLKALNIQNSFYEIVEAICDSNETKEVKGKTASNIKANVIKGVNYIPPTKALLEIVQLYVHTIPERY